MQNKCLLHNNAAAKLVKKDKNTNQPSKVNDILDIFADRITNLVEMGFQEKGKKRKVKSQNVAGQSDTAPTSF